MSWLHTHGYQAVTIDEVMKSCMTAHAAGQTIVITFDNGYPEQVTLRAARDGQATAGPVCSTRSPKDHLHPDQIWHDHPHGLGGRLAFASRTRI